MVTALEDRAGSPKRGGFAGAGQALQQWTQERDKAVLLVFLPPSSACGFKSSLYTGTAGAYAERAAAPEGRDLGSSSRKAIYQRECWYTTRVQCAQQAT